MVRKDVTKLRVFASKWWGSSSDVTLTLKVGDKVYASKTLTLGGDVKHAIIEFDFDTSDMADNTKLEFELAISSSGSEGCAIAGLQLLGALN
ncbi:MAG: hypothetical protein K2L54_04815 [Clostridiales bacterium]|nr:hypothetical protein [Clostridiales bacterium]